MQDKGVFSTLQLLRLTYPVGQEGWFARVGTIQYIWNNISHIWETSVGIAGTTGATGATGATGPSGGGTAGVYSEAVLGEGGNTDVQYIAGINIVPDFITDNDGDIVYTLVTI